MKPISYKDAGVDIDVAEKFVKEIRSLTDQTHNSWNLNSIGGFTGLIEIPLKYKQPVLVGTSDGIGTKIDFVLNYGTEDNLYTLGTDLAAVVANDIITSGARPFFLMDYMACETLDIDKSKIIIRGMVDGCRQSGMAILGGETAEMPGFYTGGRYGLAAFGVGILEKGHEIDGSKITEGDAIIGFPSVGPHANGYALINKIMKDPLAARDFIHDKTPTLLQLLAPTRIYAGVIQSILHMADLKGICHISGGGLPGNIPRILPPGLCASMDVNSWEIPEAFDLIQKWGNVDYGEMYRVFNMGIGLVVVCPKKDVKVITELATTQCYNAIEIGEIIPMRNDGQQIVIS